MELFLNLYADQCYRFNAFWSKSVVSNFSFINSIWFLLSERLVLKSINSMKTLPGLNNWLNSGDSPVLKDRLRKESTKGFASVVIVLTPTSLCQRCRPCDCYTMTSTSTNIVVTSTSLWRRHRWCFSSVTGHLFKINSNHPTSMTLFDDLSSRYNTDDLLKILYCS